MADRASAYLGGVHAGLQIVNQGFDEYWRAKDYREKMANRAAMGARQKAQDKEKREEYLSDLKERQGELALKKEHFQAEKEHWEREDKYKSNNPKSRGTDMTPAQATSALSEIDRELKNKPELLEDENYFSHRERLRNLQDPKYKPQKFQPPPEGYHPLDWLMGKIRGSGDSSGSLSPQAQKILGQ